MKEPERARSSEKETKEESEQWRVWDREGARAAGSSEGVAAFLLYCHHPPWYQLGASTDLCARPNNGPCLILSWAFPAVGTSFAIQPF